MAHIFTYNIYIVPYVLETYAERQLRKGSYKELLERDFQRRLADEKSRSSVNLNAER